MTADGWTKAVRQQLGLGRVLPLGSPRDGAWITERAADSALRRAAASLPGLSLGRLRVSSATDSGEAENEAEKEGDKGSDTDRGGPWTAVPAPPSALPPGPLRVTADLAATVSADPTAEPLPATAARLRTALFTAAGERLGLVVTEVDLRVTRLLETGAAPSPPAPGPPPSPAAGPSSSDGDGEESRVAAAALSVPGVARLTGAPGGLGRAVEIAAGPALPRRHVRVELAVTEERRALDVAREVRATVGEALPDHPSVAVLITATGV